MFAVPGWSVSADALQSEKLTPANGAPAANKSKKRKRPGAGPAQEDVTTANVADLWESVVEGKKSGGVKQGKDAKRQKNGADGKKKSGGENEAVAVKEDEPQAEVAGEKKEKKAKKDKKKKQKQNQDAQSGEVEGDAAASTSKPEAAKLPPPSSAPPAAKLTPLQASMREKLVSARFRHLNETLYTRPSEEAYQLFKDSPEMFGEYHEGFRRQVKVWPENPVDSFLEDIRTRSKVKTPGRGKSGPPPSQLAKTALPRTTGTCTIADLGCGDARLAEVMKAEKGKMRVEVKSYDLQSPSPLVTKADIADLPLEDGSVNVAVFCLALMGTNWLDFIEEAYRILHWKGELWVAEIKSRFGPVRSKNAPVDHSVGNRRKPIKKGKQQPEDPAANKEDLAVEMDGVEDRRRETDVSAFVDALKSRGFVLQGEKGESVDLSNKMFVKMHFMKGAAPTKGKGAKPQEAPRGKKAYAPKWEEEKEEGKEVNEAAILKPCLYKIR